MNQLLDHSIENKSHICITRKNGDDWQVYKSQLRSGSLNDGIALSEQCLTYGQEGNPPGEAGVSLRQGHHKLLFSTTYQDNTLGWPTKMLKISRRAYQRQQPEDSITVRFWTAEDRDQRYSQLEDISTGGMQISVPLGDFVRGSYLCSIEHSKFPIYVNAILRQAEPNENGKRMSLGFQFVGLEFDPQTATKLVRLTSSMVRQKKQTRVVAHGYYPGSPKSPLMPKKYRSCVARLPQSVQESTARRRP